MTSGKLYHRLQSVGTHIATMAMCVLALTFLPVTAADSWQEAGVIIDYGDERITWVWIPFDEHEPRLIDLLNSTELEMVTVGFGGLGEGVCQIDDTGCPAAECRQRMCQTTSSSSFWRMMALNGDEWNMTSSGVSGTKVNDGDIYALSWSAENPDLPIVTIEELAQNANADRDANVPVSALYTEGESATPVSSPDSWAPAVGALGLVVTAAGVLVFRARSSRGAAA